MPPIRSMIAIHTGWLVVAMGLLAAAAGAHNGKVAFAYPIGTDAGSGIIIDGDLSDWPPDLLEYRLIHAADGGPLDGPDDLQAWFRLAYNVDENALYVAVSVIDNSVVQGDPDGGSWDSQDGCEVYLEPYHHNVDTSPVQYQQWGHRRGIYGKGSLDDYQSAVQWRDDGYDFEYRLDISRISDTDLTLMPDHVLGLDVAIWDRDADGTRSWVAWGRERGKYAHSSRLGDVVIVGDGVPMESVLGRAGDVFETQMFHALGETRRLTGYQMFVSGVLAAVTLLHLLLLFFDPRSRPNLYYALFTGVVAAVIFTGLQIEFRQDVEPVIVNNLQIVALDVIGLLGLRFLYALFRDRPTTLFGLLLSSLLVVVGLLVVGSIYDWLIWLQDAVSIVFGVIAFAVLGETVRLIVVSIRKRRDGALIVGAGFAFFAVNISFLLQPGGADVTQLYWVLLPLASMSVYLARMIANTNRALAQQLHQVEELSTQTQVANQALSLRNDELRQTTHQLDRSNIDLREQTEQLRLANQEVTRANKAKSAFLANMSHEIRTPMNAIHSFTALIQQGTLGEINDDLRDAVAEIGSNGDHLLALINDILDLSKIEAGAMTIQRGDCAADLCIDNAMHAVEHEAQEKGVTLTARVVDDLPILQADERRLTQHVLLNLLRNAVKFTPEGAVQVGARWQDEGGAILFWVADSGIGIQEQEQQRIFDSFHQADGSATRAAEGTGLGLAIARHFVEMHGGRIWVDSTPGEGATFYFTIPTEATPSEGTIDDTDAG